MAHGLSVLVGTTKGAFILNGGENRAGWSVEGPHCDHWGINHMAGDPATGTIWAGGGGEWTGAGVWRTDDGGQTWSLSRLSGGQLDGLLASDPEGAAAVGFAPLPAPAFEEEIAAVWSLGRTNGALYAGTKPASLYRSHDRGETWKKVKALTDHESRDSWNAGGAGLTLHTILSAPDAPERLWVGISAAGVFASEDGGASWERRNRRSNADIVAAPDTSTHPAAGTGGEVGHCVHNMVRADGAGDLIYMQNHHGVFRSPDGGRKWETIGQGLPSTFGFPIAVHPRDRNMAWTFPLNGDSQGRYPIDGRPAVWRTTDGGATWEPMTNGLPERNCFFTVLRQAMATDPGDPAGVYFGTNTGSIFFSDDEGVSWEEIARHLPTVLCVEVLAREGT
ncbi:MAG: sialidase family protein [Pseudomonadota bacterium]